MRTATKDKIVEFILKGLKPATVARYLKVHQYQIAVACIDAGIESPVVPLPLTDEQLTAKVSCSKTPMIDIAKETHIPPKVLLARHRALCKIALKKSVAAEAVFRKKTKSIAHNATVARCIMVGCNEWVSRTTKYMN